MRGRGSETGIETNRDREKAKRDSFNCIKVASVS